MKKQYYYCGRYDNSTPISFVYTKYKIRSLNNKERIKLWFKKLWFKLF